MKQIFTFGTKILKSNFVRDICPYKLTFAITYKCNSKCKTCNIWKKKSKNELSINEIDKIFSKYNNFCWVDLTGGEIFLRQDITKIAEIIIKRCKNLYLLHFPTNGLMPNVIAEKTKQILKLNPKKLIVSVSLDGPKRINDKIRGIPGNFEKSLQTFSELKRLKNNKLNVFFGFTFSKYNIEHFDKMVWEVKRIIPEVSYNDFHMNIMHISTHYFNNKTDKMNRFPPKKIIIEIKKFMKKRKMLPLNPISYLEKKYLGLIKKYLITKRTPLECKALSTSCFIDPYGVVYPCSIMDVIIDNLRKNNYDLKKILYSKKTKEILKKIRKGNCPHCWTPCEAYQTILGNLLNKNQKFNI